MNLANAFSAALQQGKLTATPENPIPSLVLEGLRFQVKMLPVMFSQVHQIDELIRGLPDEQKDKIPTKTQEWLSDYSIPPVFLGFKSIDKIGLSKEFDAIIQSENPLEAVSKSSKDQYAKNAKELQEIQHQRKELHLEERSPKELESFAVTLACMRTVPNSFRCMAIYGQSMTELIQAGCNGNDEGFVRAISIDHALLGHPAVVNRMSSAALAQKTTVIDALHKAATKGPSRRITKELNELRYVLGSLRLANFLHRLSFEQLYKLLCEDLAVYANEGEDPASSLKMFVRRWEASLVQ